MFWIESLLDSLSESGVSYSDHAELFLNVNPEQNSGQNSGLKSNLPQTQLQAYWLEVLMKHQVQGLFKAASIGRQATLQKDATIRNDQISWLDEKNFIDQPILKELESWRNYLNENLFLSMRTTEAHFARYDSGHFYSRHKDRHESKGSRILSFVVYLHSEWKKGDGGELVITDGDTDRVKQIIEPLPGRVVIFRSDDIWHEVRKSNFTRYSLTGWFRHDSDIITPPASANETADS